MPAVSDSGWMRRATWLRRGAVIVVGIMLAGCGSAPQESPSPSIELVVPPTPVASAVVASPSPSPEPSASVAPLPAQPVTILLLGADSSGRTDSIMVVGVDPIAKRVTLASIPRDTINVPLPNGSVFRNRKINAFYNAAAADPRAHPEGPGRATADAVGTLLGIRIDYYAWTTFGGFSALVDSVGGVPITLPKAVSDDFLEVAPGVFGTTFPAGKQKLGGKRALVFVRIRHLGTDFDRQRRQQAFITAAGIFVLQHPAAVELLLAAARGHLRTDFPTDRVAAYQTAMLGLKASAVTGVVLGPRRYENAISCSCGYALSPNLVAIRAEAKMLFPWAVGG